VGGALDVMVELIGGEEELLANIVICYYIERNTSVSPKIHC
jgi:hypothetical protein